MADQGLRPVAGDGGWPPAHAIKPDAPLDGYVRISRGDLWEQIAKIRALSVDPHNPDSVARFHSARDGILADLHTLMTMGAPELVEQHDPGDCA